MPDFKNAVFIFDLDDTLYKEIDYVRSGNTYLLKLVQKLGFHVADAEELDVAQVGFIDKLIAHASLPSTIKDELIWSYRLHVPELELTREVLQTIETVVSKAFAVGVITDGRSITQRLKLKSLGLSHLPAFISEDYQAGKPLPLMFEAVEQTWPQQKYVYVADNPVKDFISPNAMGWRTIGLIDDGHNVRRGNLKWCDEFGDKEHCPDTWIHTFSKLLELDFS